MVEEVEGLETQLDRCSLRDLRVFLDREVGVPVAWPTEESARHIAERSECGTGHRSRIKPIVVLDSEHRRTRIQCVWHGDQVRTIRAGIERPSPTASQRICI